MIKYNIAQAKFCGAFGKGMCVCVCVCVCIHIYIQERMTKTHKNLSENKAFQVGKYGCSCINGC